ncbi:uncharacterized protein LOC119314800 isoform X1 [Triticum dicoccoides]|uniref:uncharacterized protein LOC119314800 isoform X1 n=1 Tax=Triticum dicoccoides TaxID=85692 RepID=UPI001891D63D|nr:uncharacterized protein LOC119314800 isoform X1 [Triticum dicoccoides]
MFNKSHDVLPRISLFDQISVRRMINMAAVMGTSVASYSNSKLRPALDVCYARRNYPDCLESITNQQVKAASQDHSRVQQTDERADAGHGSSLSIGHLLDVETPLRAIGPLDFSQYLRSRYPNLVTNEITILLKEQNASCQRQINTTRVNMHADMFKFTQELMTTVGNRCTCCSARGFNDCPARANEIRRGKCTHTSILAMQPTSTDPKFVKEKTKEVSHGHAKLTPIKKEIDGAEHLITSRRGSTVRMI